MITRRNTIQLGLIGVLATAFRSTFSADTTGENAFADSVLESMKLRKININIGLKEAFKVVQATDSHFTYVSATDFEKLDSKSMEWYNSRSKIFAGGIPGLAAALLHAKNLKAPLFHTGDLLDFPSQANLDMIKRDLSMRDWFFAMGNHEYHGWGPGKPAIQIGKTAEERMAGRKLFSPYLPNPIPVASRVIGGVNFVQYDNGGFSDHMGFWQLEQIKNEFAKGLPVVMLCHMPFFVDELVEQMVVTKKLVKEKINDG
jgi:predicted MPP superfamily phosphohydrolase